MSAQAPSTDPLVGVYVAPEDTPNSSGGSRTTAAAAVGAGSPVTTGEGAACAQGNNSGNAAYGHGASHSGHTPNDSNPPSRNLFVTGFPKALRDPGLKALFADFGPTESCRVMLDIYTGAPRGFAFVLFDRVEDAVKAQAALNGKPIAVNRDDAATEPGATVSPIDPAELPASATRLSVTFAKHTAGNVVSRSTRAYCRNVPMTSSEADVKSFFIGLGYKCVSAHIRPESSRAPPMYSREGHAPPMRAVTNVAFVEFETCDEADRATQQTLEMRMPNAPGPLMTKLAESTELRSQRRRTNGSASSSPVGSANQAPGMGRYSGSQTPTGTPHASHGSPGSYNTPYSGHGSTTSAPMAVPPAPSVPVPPPGWQWQQVLVPAGGQPQPGAPPAPGPPPHGLPPGAMMPLPPGAIPGAVPGMMPAPGVPPPGYHMPPPGYHQMPPHPHGALPAGTPVALPPGYAMPPPMAGYPMPVPPPGAVPMHPMSAQAPPVPPPS